MRLAFRISLLAIRLASLLGAGATSVGSLVEFPNLPGQQPTHLTGYLARPDTGLAAELSGDGRSNGGGPFPAVVVLHGCIGLTGHFTGIADRLTNSISTSPVSPPGGRCDGANGVFFGGIWALLCSRQGSFSGVGSSLNTASSSCDRRREGRSERKPLNS